MRLIELILKAKGLGFNFIAVDEDKQVYGYMLMPVFKKIHGSIMSYWENDKNDPLLDVEQYIGNYEDPVSDASKCILTINKLTLRNVL